VSPAARVKLRFGETFVLALVYLTSASCRDAISLAALARLAARYELVLVCEHRAVADGLIPALRRTLPRHRLATLVVDGEIMRQERELVEQLLEVGTIPLILTVGDLAASRPTSWLWIGADTIMVLPAEVATAA
jgi:hypothetical protein